MTPEQTISELARLAAAYGQKLEPEQAAAYVQHLGTLADHVAFSNAIDNMIRSETFFPRIATVLAAYNAARERRALAARPKELEAGEIERLPIPDSAKAWLAGNSAWAPQKTVIDAMPKAAAGKCDDCKETTFSERVRYGSFTLCHGCAQARARAKALAA